jgi:hypothetical protein
MIKVLLRKGNVSLIHTISELVQFRVEHLQDALAIGRLNVVQYILPLVSINKETESLAWIMIVVYRYSTKTREIDALQRRTALVFAFTLLNDSRCMVDAIIKRSPELVNEFHSSKLMIIKEMAKETELYSS